MRATAIPAQVTTVEDRIVGNLNLGQLLLLSVPVFGGGLLYVILPPIMAISGYKLLLLCVLVFICGLSAIRIKGMIVLLWLRVLLRYWLRPRYYLFDKRSTHGRVQYQSISRVNEEEVIETPGHVRESPALSFEDIAKVQELITNPAAQVAFEARKGGLYVRIREIKQEG